MKVLITGATGLVGSALVPFLESHGCLVTRLMRPRDWNPETGKIDLERLEGFDAVIHLAGENIASGRWTAARKAQIMLSRAMGTRLLAESLTKLQRPPKVLVTASAIGYYGSRGDRILTEESPAGTGFLANVCKTWESASEPAVAHGIRVVRLRIGVVLSAKGGALAKMRRPFHLGLGGALGTGRQYMSWVTLRDLCRIVYHVLQTPSLSGAVNAVSPHPVTNREFTHALASAMHRPALFSVPRLAVRTAMGELGNSLLLASMRVVPAKLEASGFHFEDTDIALALHRIMGKISALHTSQWVARPIEQVFPFFANSNNLERITPPWLQFEVLNPGVDVQRGSLIDYRLRIHGIPVSWQSEIVDWEPPYRFVDVQRHGPYSLWIHEHRFESKDGGTLIRDDVQYSAFGGYLVRKFLVDRDLHRIFDYRKDRLAELLTS
jgi:hypothetical protein